jgi:hypothetical protein
MVVMVDTSRINAELHVSLFLAATIAYCHELILSGVVPNSVGTRDGDLTPGC